MDGNPTSDRACGRARILIVEDNALNRLLVHDLLELRGHTILEAATVEEARGALDGPDAAGRADPGRRRRGRDP